MELRNLTPYCAHLFRGVLDEDTIVAVAVCRLTCRVQGTGRLEPLKVQEAVRVDAGALPDGIFDDDGAPLKPGVEVLVMGDAIPVPGPTASEMTVSLRVGDETREVRVFGDRVWELAPGMDREEALDSAREGKHDAGALVASEPEPFERMPLVWERAFGGMAEVYEDGEVAGLVPPPENLAGVGHYLHLEQALGAPLPNQEDPEAPLSHWSEPVRPTSLGPLNRASGVRMDRGVSADGPEVAITEELYLSAPPEQVFEELEPGTEVEVRGMSPGGLVRFRVPDMPVEVEVTVGDHRSTLPCRLDTVEIFPNEDRAAFVLRAAFQYPIREEEERLALISLSEKPRLS